MSGGNAQQPLLQHDALATEHPSSDRRVISPHVPERLHNPKLRSWLKAFLQSHNGHVSVLVLVTLDVSCIFADLFINLFTCDQRHHRAGWATALQVLSIASLVFSCLFMLELSACIWAFGSSYFKSWFRTFDALVIVLGFAIDVALQGTVEQVASLVIVLRLWRIFKIVEEFSAGANDQLSVLQERIADLEEQNAQLRAEIGRLHYPSHV